MSYDEVVLSRPRADGDFNIALTDLPLHALDDQPFGIIRLSSRGIVLSYNRHEQTKARRRPESVIGRNFFREVAPCTQVKEFYGRFLDGVERRDLNTTFGFLFTMPHGERHVDISLFYKASDDSVWVLIRG